MQAWVLLRPRAFLHPILSLSLSSSIFSHHFLCSPWTKKKIWITKSSLLDVECQCELRSRIWWTEQCFTFTVYEVSTVDLKCHLRLVESGLVPQTSNWRRHTQTRTVFLMSLRDKPVSAHWFGTFHFPLLVSSLSSPVRFSSPWIWIHLTVAGGSQAVLCFLRHG